MSKKSIFSPRFIEKFVDYNKGLKSTCLLTNMMVEREIDQQDYVQHVPFRPGCTTRLKNVNFKKPKIKKRNSDHFEHLSSLIMKQQQESFMKQQ